MFHVILLIYIDISKLDLYLRNPNYFDNIKCIFALKPTPGGVPSCY